MTSVLRVVPIGDLVQHQADDDCACGPTAKPIKAADGAVGWLMVHHSLDGREPRELETTAPGG